MVVLWGIIVVGFAYLIGGLLWSLVVRPFRENKRYEKMIAASKANEEEWYRVQQNHIDEVNQMQELNAKWKRNARRGKIR